MTGTDARVLSWSATWNKQFPGVGMEHVLVAGEQADGVLLGVDEDCGPFRMSYRLTWSKDWQLLSASMDSNAAGDRRTLDLVCDGKGRWATAAGTGYSELDGCLDIDIWPTPLTNTFPIRRARLAVGERREFSVVWVHGPKLTFQRQRQAYTRLSDDQYGFEVLDGSGFAAILPVDRDGFVKDYPGLFKRIGAA